MSIKKKIVWLPYDMDTAIGINNDGQMVFGYELEDIDHQAGGAPVYNGQDSVVWKNIRAAFGPELAAMYQTLRSSGNFSYEAVEQAFEEHQAKWAEAIYNEDAEFKYIKPFVENSANYLYMLLGSKAEQRKWWLYNRFRYIDSKYIAGDARTDAIFLRPYAAANITVIPYADIYATVAWDATITQERAARNRAVTLICPYQSMNGNIVNIYSSSQLASVGDLAPLKVGQIDISSATRLQALKIGDSDSEYENTNLYSLTFGANTLLKSIDARGCSGLGDTSMTGHTQTTVDISGCSIIEHVYMEGTKIQGITLPNGGVLKTLHLPSTITNLTILNQPSITSFVVEGGEYSNISTLRLENVSSAVDEKAILMDLPAAARVRLIGINWECADAAEIDSLLDVLDTMRGLDEQGGNVDKAQVSGTIHTTALTGAQIAEFESRYPYITYDADYVESTLTLKTWDESSTVATITCYNGTPQSAIPTPPSRANSSDGHYSYTAVGWNLSQDAQVDDPTCVQNVNADRTVYAAYSRTVLTYPVTYVRATADGGGTLYTLSNVDWGTTITAASSYGGSTPTTTQGSATDYPFEGWEPASATVTGATTFTAKFGSPVEVAEITDSWDTIIANIDNGTYKTAYKIGNYKPLDLGTEGTINMQIVAMDADELASGGYAPLTFIGIELLNTKRAINSSQKTIDGKTGYASGGWLHSNIRQYLQDTVLPLISTASDKVAQRLQVVVKTQDSNIEGQYGQITEDKLWLPSNYEVGVASAQPSTNIVSYASVFKNNTSRIKNINGTASYWWLRSTLSNSHFDIINNSGSSERQQANSFRGVCLGFCLGLEPETIEDDWSTILANTNPSESYAIGDTKMIDLGTEGKHLMEIVAFDTDDKADGTGKAKITWISKTLLNTEHRMNPALSPSSAPYTEGTGTIGGWEKSEMRTYLKETIKPLIPATVRNGIVNVTKISNAYNTSGTAFQQTTTDDVWIPSYREIFNSTSYERTGAVYSSKFTNDASRIKKRNDSIAADWYLRSANTNKIANKVRDDGIANAAYVKDELRIALGFCTDVVSSGE